MNTKCIACNHPLVARTNISYCVYCGLGQTISKPKVSYLQYHRDEEYAARSKQFANIFAKRVNIIEHFKKTGKILEIGSSTGEMLALFKNWKVVGVEPSQKAAKTAQQKNVETINVSFEQAKLPYNYFDVVIMNHVLEHVDNPIIILNKINLVLKPGGIVFIDVPNFGSLSSILMKTKWPYLLLEEHNWHFTKKSLELLLQECGFKTIYWETRSGIWDYGNPLLELLDSLVSFKKRFFVNLVTAIPSWIMGKLKMGTSLTILGIKCTK